LTVSSTDSIAESRSVSFGTWRLFSFPNSSTAVIDTATHWLLCSKWAGFFLWGKSDLQGVGARIRVLCLLGAPSSESLRCDRVIVNATSWRYDPYKQRLPHGIEPSSIGADRDFDGTAPQRNG
jgi:hypothetical protein